MELVLSSYAEGIKKEIQDFKDDYEPEVLRKRIEVEFKVGEICQSEREHLLALLDGLGIME